LERRGASERASNDDESDHESCTRAAATNEKLEKQKLAKYEAS